MKKYKARKGANFSDKEAQIYGERIGELIKIKNGKVTPIDVINDAKDKKSPYHNYFQWDDTKASFEYRLQQARNLLNHVIEVVVVEGVKSEQRSFFSVSSKPTKFAYVTLKKALTTTSHRKQILNQTITALENATSLIKLFRSYEK